MLGFENSSFSLGPLGPFPSFKMLVWVQPNSKLLLLHMLILGHSCNPSKAVLLLKSQ